MSRRGPRNLVAALLVGALVGIGATLATEARQQQRLSAWEAARNQPLPPPSARLQAAIDEIREDGVHVTDDARSRVDRDAEAAIEAAAASTDNPVYSIVWTHSNHAGDGYEAVKDKLEHAFSGERALIHVWEGPGRGFTVLVGAEIRTSNRDADLDFVGDPAVVLPRAVLAAEQATWLPPRETGPHDGYWGGTGGAVAAGVLFGTVATSVLLLLLALLGRATRGRLGLPGRWGWV